MARIKNYCGFELKTGGLIIGFVSFFANILYLITTIEAVLLYSMPVNEEKKKIFGWESNELTTSSIAFPIILVGAVAALYGVISSYLLICGVKNVSFSDFQKRKVQLHSRPLISLSRDESSLYRRHDLIRSSTQMKRRKKKRKFQ